MNKIPQNPVADTGVRLSALGLGTVKFGRREKVKYPRPFALPDDDTIRALLDTARAAGINLLDTAPAYGAAQKRIGKLVGGDPEWVICGKVGEQFSGGASRYDYSAAAVTAAVEGTLRELRRDALDIALIHSNGADEDIINNTAAVETLQRLKAQGKVRAIGLSGKTVAGGLLALKSMDVVMCEYHLGDASQLPVLQAAAAAGKSVLIKKGLQSGHLDHANTADPVQAAHDHIFAQSAVTALVVGTINPRHLRQNIDAACRAIARAAATRPAPAAPPPPAAPAK